MQKTKASNIAEQNHGDKSKYEDYKNYKFN